MDKSSPELEVNHIKLENERSASQVEPQGQPHHNPYRSKNLVVVGVLLVLCGVVGVVCNGIGIGMQPYRERLDPAGDNFHYITRYYNIYFYIATGIWCGLILIITGGLAIGRGGSRCQVTSALVLACISVPACLVFIVFSALQAHFEASQNYRSDVFNWFTSFSIDLRNDYDKVSYAMAIILAIDAGLSILLVIGVIIITSRLLCCKQNQPGTAIPIYPRQPPINAQNTVGSSLQPESNPNQTSAYLNPPGAYANQPGADLNQPGAYPNQPGAYPNHPGADPNQPNAYPNPPSAYPNQSGAYSNQPGAYPNQPGAFTSQPSAFVQQPSNNVKQTGFMSLFRRMFSSQPVHSDYPVMYSQHGEVNSHPMLSSDDRSMHSRRHNFGGHHSNSAMHHGMSSLHGMSSSSHGMSSSSHGMSSSSRGMSSSSRSSSFD